MTVLSWDKAQYVIEDIDVGKEIQMECYDSDVVLFYRSLQFYRNRSPTITIHCQNMFQQFGVKAGLHTYTHDHPATALILWQHCHYVGANIVETLAPTLWHRSL